MTFGFSGSVCLAGMFVVKFPIDRVSIVELSPTECFLPYAADLVDSVVHCGVYRRIFDARDAKRRTCA